MALDVRPLSNALGAEVIGLDVGSDLTSEALTEIMDAWHQHLVLVFRDQTLTEEQQIAFAQHFGTLQKRPRPKSMRGDIDKNQYPDITMLISNIRENGKLIGSLPDGEVNFHSDMCFEQRPPMAAFLYAIEVPKNGGDTLFANMYQVYEDLTPEVKEKLHGKTALNVYLYGAPTRADQEPDLSVSAHYRHPAIRTHPKTHRDLLFVNRLMTRRLDGVSLKESDEILDQLFDQIERPKYVYAHKWRVGDLLLWDNRCTQHARTDFDANERRLLRRIVVQGEDVPFEGRLRTAAVS